MAQSEMYDMWLRESESEAQRGGWGLIRSRETVGVTQVPNMTGICPTLCVELFKYCPGGK